MSLVFKIQKLQYGDISVVSGYFGFVQYHGRHKINNCRVHLSRSYSNELYYFVELMQELIKQGSHHYNNFSLAGNTVLCISTTKIIKT